jgi:tetratricopeptide (TPR) repeat protein
MAKFNNDDLSKIKDILTPLDKDPIKFETLNPTAKFVRKIKGLPEPNLDEPVEEPATDEIEIGDSEEENQVDAETPPAFKNFDEEEDDDLDIDELLNSASDIMSGGDIPSVESLKKDTKPDDFTHTGVESNINKEIESSEEDELLVEPNSQDSEDTFSFDDKTDDDPFATNEIADLKSGSTNPFQDIITDDSQDPFKDFDPNATSDSDPFANLGGDSDSLGETSSAEDPFGVVPTTEEEDPFANLGGDSDSLGETSSAEDPFGVVPTTEEEDPFANLGGDSDSFGEKSSEEDPFGVVPTTEEEDPFANLGGDSDSFGEKSSEEDPFGVVPTTEEDPFGTGVTNSKDPLDDLDDNFGDTGSTEEDPFGVVATTEEDPFGSVGSNFDDNLSDDAFDGLGEEPATTNQSAGVEEEDPFSTASFNAVDDSPVTDSGMESGFGETSDENSGFDTSDQDHFSDFQQSTDMGDYDAEGLGSDISAGSLDTIDDYSTDEPITQTGNYESLEDDLDSLAEEEEATEELSDEELAVIQQEIINYPPKLKRAVIDAITNERLSKSDQNGLIELIKTSQKPEDIAEYLSEKLGYQVDLFDKTGAYSERGIPVIATKDIYTKEGELRRRQLIKRTALLAAAGILAVIGLVSSYKYVLRPFQASRYYNEGIEYIKKAGDSKNSSERLKYLADSKSAFAKGEKIEPNNLEYLNKFGIAYMKIGEYDLAFEKLFGSVEPDFGAEPNGESESWQKRTEVPLIQLSPKTPWSNDKIPIGGKIVPENESMVLISGTGRNKVERKIKKAGAYIVSRLEKNIHDNNTYISLGKFHSNIANLFQKPMLNGNRNYKNDNLAINYYKEVFTDGQDPDNVEATSGLAKIYYNQKNFTKSVFYYNKIVDKFPSNPIGHGGLLSNFIEMWKKDKNPTFVLNHHRQVRNALNIEEDLSLFTLSKLASFYIDLSANDVRIKYNINPEDQVTNMDLQDNVEHLLNIAFFKTEKQDDGMEVKGDEYAEGYYQRGRYLLKKGETVQALRQFELSAKYDPAHYLSVLEMAEYYMRINDYNESIALLENSLKRYENNKDLYGNKEEDETLFFGDYARIYFNKGKIFYLESALLTKEGKITEFPDRKVYPDRSLGQLSEEESNRRKNLNNAMMMFEKAQENKLQNQTLLRELFYYKGWIEYMRSDYETALNEWSNLAEEDIYSNPNVMLGRANAFYYLDQINASLGNYIKLKEDFEEKESQIARPSYDESVHQEIYNVLIATYNNIGAIYEKKGNTTQALKHYWKAIEIARKINLTTEISNHNKDMVFKTKREDSGPLLDDWLSPTIDTIKDLLNAKKGKF